MTSTILNPVERTMLEYLVAVNGGWPLGRGRLVEEALTMNAGASCEECFRGLAFLRHNHLIVEVSRTDTVSPTSEGQEHVRRLIEARQGKPAPSVPTAVAA